MLKNPLRVFSTATATTATEKYNTLKISVVAVCCSCCSKNHTERRQKSSMPMAVIKSLVKRHPDRHRNLLYGMDFTAQFPSQGKVRLGLAYLISVFHSKSGVTVSKCHGVKVLFGFQQSRNDFDTLTRMTPQYSVTIRNKPVVGREKQTT